MAVSNNRTTWYRDGTITLANGSTSVVGVGTLWAYSGVLDGGDLFTIDGSKFYEIASIEDDTHLTLRTAFAEASLTNSIYAIIPNFSVQPAADILGKNMLLINKWLIREQELLNWQTKPANATTPAMVELHAWDGSVQSYKSLPQIISELGTVEWVNVIDKPPFAEIWANLDPTTKQNHSANLDDWSNTTLISMASKTWTNDQITASLGTAFTNFDVPTDGILYGRKDKQWVEIKRRIPFYLADGSNPGINLTSDEKIPFTRADGTPSNIPVIA